MYELASNVQLSNWLRERILYIWGRFSIHLRLILYTFEADSLYIWGPICTFEAEFIYFGTCDLSEPIREQDLYIWGRLQNRPQMYRELASNVQQNRPQM